MKLSFTASARTALLASFSLVFLLSGCPAGQSKQTLAAQGGASKTSRISQELSRDFKAISQGVTPTVVSISTISKDAAKLKTESRLDREKFKDQYGFSHPPSERDKENGLGSGVVVDA